MLLQPDGTRGEEHQIKSIKQGAVAASVFAVPAGYTKHELPVMGAGHGHGPGAGRTAPPAPPPKP